MIAPIEVVTVRLAIDPSTQANGCMYVIPRTHNTGREGFSDYDDLPPGEAVFPDEVTASQRDTVAIIDIGDTVLIEKKVIIGGTPTTRAQELAVEGLEHRITFDGGMTTRLYTSPTDIVAALILDDAVDGILDTNALG